MGLTIPTLATIPTSPTAIAAMGNAQGNSVEIGSDVLTGAQTKGAQQSATQLQQTLTDFQKKQGDIDKLTKQVAQQPLNGKLKKDLATAQDSMKTLATSIKTMSTQGGAMAITALQHLSIDQQLSLSESIGKYTDDDMFKGETKATLTAAQLKATDKKLAPLTKKSIALQAKLDQATANGNTKAATRFTKDLKATEKAMNPLVAKEKASLDAQASVKTAQRDWLTSIEGNAANKDAIANMLSTNDAAALGKQISANQLQVDKLQKLMDANTNKLKVQYDKSVGGIQKAVDSVTAKLQAAQLLPKTKANEKLIASYNKQLATYGTQRTQQDNLLATGLTKLNKSATAVQLTSLNTSLNTLKGQSQADQALKAKVTASELVVAAQVLAGNTEEAKAIGAQNLVKNSGVKRGLDQMRIDLIS